MKSLKGRAHVYGDNIDTDRIIPGKYTKTLDLDQLAAHVLEDLDPGFRERLRRGDILVGGSNLGMGSSREQAPLAIQAAGIAAVVASSFARIFFRNAINIGLPVIEVGVHTIQNGSELELDLTQGNVIDHTSGRTYPTARMPQVMVDILMQGGLVPYLRKHRSYMNHLRTDQ